MVFDGDFPSENFHLIRKITRLFRQVLITHLISGHVGYRIIPDTFPVPQAKTEWESSRSVKQLNYLESCLSGRRRLASQDISLAD